MTAVISLLSKVCFDLQELKAPFALIGALAVGTYGDARSTRDVDLAVVHDKRDEQERFIASLLERGYADRVMLMHSEPAQHLGDRLSLKDSHGSNLAIDFLCSSSGIEAEVVARAVVVELLPGVSLPVASRGDLIAMKVLSRNSTDRLRDDLDLQVLLSGASSTDIKLATQACELIAARGFHRHKDLLIELNQVLERFR